MTFSASQRVNRSLLAWFICCVGFAFSGGFSYAEDVAVFDIRVGKEKQLQRVVIEFYDREAPRTVENFKQLVARKFYNGTAFHRVFPHQMIQGGDPFSRKKERRKVGTGGPGYTLPAEVSGRRSAPGSVAMARLGDKVNPSRVNNGSQFFITLAPMPSLDGQYTIFGYVSEGLEVVDLISTKSADTNDNPVDRVVIERALIASKGDLPPIPKVKKRFLPFFPGN